MPVPSTLLSDAPLDRFTTIRVGGNADYLAEPASSRGVVSVLRWAEAEGLPVAVVGKGSNLVVDDAGFRGVARPFPGRSCARPTTVSAAWNSAPASREPSAGPS
jgi:hypothetical protein